MKAHLKILISLSTLIFLGVGVLHSALAGVYSPKENAEPHQIFLRDFEGGY
ncbi:hypothetical protein V5F77_09765 [Xanthobacter sp. DSM 24535]|uniref:hypothetical protein n=1 Tax=Roseixanthobacter psychrophilus TaxID=3119917 RepID=UPI00372830E9